ncbi:AraC family transcriptional regulator [Paenibacillaceae bacterium]|nr:AraC family transcriptional regulator [Paenibacillaceae bacterium]
MATKLLEPIHLHQIPYRLSYRRYTDNNYSGYYHCHQGMEILYVYQGTGTLMMNSRIYPLQPGTLVFIQPFQLHRVQMDVAVSHPYERTIVSLEPSVFQSYFQPFPHLQEFFHTLWSGNGTNSVYQGAGSDNWLEGLFSLHHNRLAELPDFECIHEFGLLVVQLFQYLQQLGLGPGKLNQRTGDSIRSRRHSEQIMNWIESHYHEEPLFDRLTEHLHLTKPYISRIFRQEIGSSVMEYVNARRLRQACWLLTTTDQTVAQIGIAVGIPNFSYFCQLFKKTFGLPPNQYRKKSILA